MTGTARSFRTAAYGIKRNPLPLEAIASDGDPYSDEAFSEELEEFHDKVIVSGLSPRRQIAFLYSHNQQGGADTGFGKTRTMMQVRTDINTDLGTSLLAELVEPEEIVPIGAAYASFNTNARTGYYPVMVAAVLDAATAGDTPLLVHVHNRLVTQHGDAPDAIRAALAASQVALGVNVREAIAAAFCADGAPGVVKNITSTTDATKLRSGMDWLLFLLVAMHAAGIARLFLFIDQLEDLATNKAQTRAKRFREIGRIRDLLEDEPTSSMLHTTFTMHDTAAIELEPFWEAHRLPAYQLTRANMNQIVLLEGLTDDGAAAAVLASWLAPARIADFSGEAHHPFELSGVRALRVHAQGRVGAFLVTAAKVLDAGINERRPSIDDEFVREVLTDSATGGATAELAMSGGYSDDDLLA